MYKLTLRKERRLSAKIIMGKLHTRLPKPLYDLLMLGRYATFRRLCSNDGLPHITYSDGSWINRKMTKDLQTIRDFLLTEPKGQRLLQIGVGNSGFFETMKEHAREIVGVTIVEDEVARAKTLAAETPECPYTVILKNKYTADYTDISGLFDYIIDNDLSSYACCRTHFADMLNAYRHLLAPHGAILVGLRGLGYFDSGFGLTEGLARKLFAQAGLNMEKTTTCYKLTRA